MLCVFCLAQSSLFVQSCLLDVWVYLLVHWPNWAPLSWGFCLLCDLVTESRCSSRTCAVWQTQPNPSACELLISLSMGIALVSVAEMQDSLWSPCLNAWTAHSTVPYWQELGREREVCFNRCVQLCFKVPLATVCALFVLALRTKMCIGLEMCFDGR